MAKNIVIFSDGTGQAGGLMPDETRSNVYKLYRATRCGPDNAIVPSRQLTFYDPGLGSKSDGSGFKWSRLLRGIYNLLAQATGLGITRNIVDCYAEIIRLWQPGDRIFLFGFSRGAYTARCVSGVLAYCGVPTSNNGEPLKRDPASARAIAEVAVRDVYQYGSSIKGDPRKPERLARAAAFRAKYGSADGDRPNAAPYFIGVWDTVSTLGAGHLAAFVAIFGFAFVTAAVRYGLHLFLPPISAAGAWAVSAAIVATVAVAIYVAASVHYGQLLSLARYRMAFYDTKLNPRVSFARHALSIDENRRDFARVLWDEDGSEQVATLPDGPERFKQVWFAGVHSDVGGRYAENEARLSDIALRWMVDEACSLPHPLEVDTALLRLAPAADGIQHDERKMTIAGWWNWVRVVGLRLLGPDRMGWPKGIRKIDPEAPLHPTVLQRFELASVQLYDETGPYRPEALRNHNAVKEYY